MWKEQFDKRFPTNNYPHWKHDSDVKDFISTEVVEKIVQDSKTMTSEELTAKWL
jgi:hypothetical protein